MPAGTGNLFNAILEALGLRLEPRKQEVELIAIDHLERGFQLR